MAFWLEEWIGKSFFSNIKKASNSKSSNIGFGVSLKRNLSDKMVEKKNVDFEA